jgi:hypothetical protein
VRALEAHFQKSLKSDRQTMWRRGTAPGPELVLGSVPTWVPESVPEWVQKDWEQIQPQ